jgi:hypothetical protein
MAVGGLRLLLLPAVTRTHASVAGQNANGVGRRAALPRFVWMA